MMRCKIRIAAVFLAVIMISNLTGCQLALKDAGTSINKDRLIGVFLTKEYLDLFDIEGYLNDNTGSFSGREIKLDESEKKYQDRLYAELRPKTHTNTETGEKIYTEEYVFPSVKGITYFLTKIPATAESDSYITSGSDEAISDGHMNITPLYFFHSASMQKAKVRKKLLKLC